MLGNDFTEFSQSSSYSNITSNDNIFSINLGLLFYNCEKKDYNANPKLNIGITFNSGSTVNAYYYRNQSFRFDTLSSPTSTNVIYLDSVTNESYRMNYFFEQIGINTNLIFRTQPNARWSIYSGFGVSATASLRTETHISYYLSKNMYYVFPGTGSTSSFSSNNDDTFESYDEIHANKTNVSCFAYIPLGIDFRIAKKNEFWNKMHLVMEMQPGLAIDYIPELGTTTYGVFRANFGLRIEI
jgi:hypothetical protein